MVMDLEPVNKIGGFLANLTDWDYIDNVLKLADVNTDKRVDRNYNQGFSISHDNFVDEKTAKKWGEAILRILPNLYNLHVPDKSFIQDEYCDVPIIAKDVSELVEIALVKSKPYELDKGTREWLMEFAEFCINSGGFHQY